MDDNGKPSKTDQQQDGDDNSPDSKPASDVKNDISDAVLVTDNPAAEAPAKKPAKAKSGAKTVDPDTADMDSKPAGKSRWLWRLLLLLIVLASLAASALVVWLNRQQAQQITTLQQQLQSIGRQVSQQQQQESVLQQAQQKLQTADAGLQQQLQTISRQAAHNERQLVQLAGSDRQDWLVAEAEYLLRLANQRLNLERDVDSSRAMLEAADKVLAETRNPAFDAVRSKLAHEIQSLRLVPGVDRVGAVVRLQAMQDALDQVNWLPVTGIQPSSHSTSNSPVVLAWYEQLWQQVKAGLADVIRIRRQDTPVAVPLSPEQAYYLQQNARLMLEQAQLAMLRRDQNLYDRSLQRVIGWIDQYLPDEDVATRELRLLVKELQGWQVNPAIPDISGSLQLLRDRLALANDGVMPLDEAPQQGSKSTSEPDGAQP